MWRKECGLDGEVDISCRRMLAGGSSTRRQRRIVQPQGQWVRTELQHQDGGRASTVRRRSFKQDAGRRQGRVLAQRSPVEDAGSGRETTRRESDGRQQVDLHRAAGHGMLRERNLGRLRGFVQNM